MSLIIASTGAAAHRVRRCSSPPRCGSQRLVAGQSLQKPRSAAGRERRSHSRSKAVRDGADAYSCTLGAASLAMRARGRSLPPHVARVSSGTQEAERRGRACGSTKQLACVRYNSPASAQGAFSASVRQVLKKPQAVHQPVAASVAQGRDWQAVPASQHVASLAAQARSSAAAFSHAAFLHFAASNPAVSCAKHAQLPGV